MNPENEGTLSALLREALSSITITRGSSSLDPHNYRRMVQTYRARYEPNLQFHTFIYDIHIDDARVREAILDLLRVELARFIHEDRTYSATYAIFGGRGSGSSVPDILKSLAREAIVAGPERTTRAFYSGIALGYIPFQDYFLLSGIRVEQEIRIFDGISLVPLPNSSADLPAYLPTMFNANSLDFLSKTLLRVDMAVSPVLHKPAEDDTFASGPEKYFNIAIRSTDATDFDPSKFFLALTLAGEHPVFSMIRWTHLSDEHIFDLRIGPGSGYSSDSRSASSTVISEAQVDQAIGFYAKITNLSLNVQKRLQIPIDRWMKSKTHQNNVDKMIDLGIAMESFYLRGIRDELSFRFRLRASLYLEDGLEQRKMLKNRFRKIYDVRSVAVHEGTVPKSVKVEGNDVRISDFLESSQELFKRSLLKVIEHGQFPNWDTIELGGGNGTEGNSSEPTEFPPVTNNRTEDNTVTTEKVNRLQIFYNSEHKPYLYGAVHIVDGSVDNQRSERPFIVSKRNSGGEEMVYGTVKRNLSKVQSQLDRVERFHSESQAKLESAGIAPPVSGDPILPESELADRILDEQDDLLEDVLLTTSVNIRILSEIFPQRLKKRKVTVYDYDDGEVDKIELSKIADLLLHNRYLVIRGYQVVDLISDEQFMAAKPQMGLKINLAGYLSEIEKVVSGLTVKDLIGKLWSMTKVLSTSSSIKDIIFLTQNLYTLGDSVMRGAASVNAGPLKAIFDRITLLHAKRMYPIGSTAEKAEIVATVVFTTPRFYLEPDLDRKQIRTEVYVNGNLEKLIMDYEDFFSEVAKASGTTRLYAKPDH